jgi:heterodisulfide reductase subunit C
MPKPKTVTNYEKGTAETLAQTIQGEIDENVFLCYQCVKCTASSATG